MKILVDFGGYHVTNHGDLAMLQVGVSRLRRLLPGVELTVFTAAPDRLLAAVPGVKPLVIEGRNLFLADMNLFGALHRLMPGNGSQHSLRLEAMVRRTWPKAAAGWAARRMTSRGVDVRPMFDYIQAVSDSQAVIATGGGYLTDPFEVHAVTVLELFALASALGKPFALFGQGIGPIDSPRLLGLSRSILPSARLIALRERRRSAPLLQALGVPPDRIRVTGDDAIEMAYLQRPEEFGSSIGFNMRVARYSEVDPGQVLECFNTTKRFARGRGASVLPVPIASGPADNDVAQFEQNLPLDEAEARTLESLTSPEAVIRQVGKCRVVVTGSYHAGVFALSQGIPVVGLSKSAYYRDKFAGLAEQFEVGSIIVNLSDADLRGQLERAITRLWDEAPGLREPLLRSAERQIAASQEAFADFAKTLATDEAARGGRHAG